MLISKIQVLNYKSFRDSGWIDFRPAINIITGQNSAGKTALLEALTLAFKNIPHKSISILPTPSSPLNTQSKVNFSLNLTEQEVIEIAARIPKPYYIPHPASGNIGIPEAIQLFQAWLDNPKLQTYSLSIEGDSTLIINDFSKELAFGLYEAVSVASGWCNHIQLQEDINGRLISSSYSTSNIRIIDGSFGHFFKIIQKRIYRFLAERLNVSTCSRNFSPELSSNASNLPEVLGIMQGDNPELFNLFNRYVSIIFPQIKRITVSQGQHIEIKVWYIDPSTYRNDLSFPLSDCGTGIGQVLSILYVVLTAHNPRVVIIDEPQSFLHPGAAKKLIEVIREIGKTGNFPQHQYIISTHSPTIISSAEPTTIVMLRYIESCETALSIMNSEDTRELKTLLDEVGVRLSDVFGMDKILWVEGPTEEKCYPLIIKEILKKPLRGIQVLAIKNTGDLEGKRAHVIFDVYDKLSGTQNLFPPAIGFLFDRELRTTQEMNDLRKRSSNPVKFLHRRMYENYLLHSEAIVNILNNLDQCRENPITSVDINVLLNEARQEKSYFPKNVSNKNLLDRHWVDMHIDGARVLKDIFSRLSESRVEFSKSRDSVKLTEWLILNQPESLEEISKLLDEVLPAT
jgi:predicted ATPase